MRKNGGKAAIVAGSYAVVVLVVGLGILFALLAGKDSVVLWPLFFLTIPLGPILFWLLSLVPTEGIPVEQRWMIPIVDWAFFLLAGLIQAWLLWRVLRGPRVDQPDRHG